MSELLCRRAVKTAPREIRRILLGACVLVVTSLGWYALRAPLVVSLARNSVGCAVRARLLAAGIRALDPSLPVGEYSDSLSAERWHGPGWPGGLCSWRQGKSAGVMWESAMDRQWRGGLRERPSSMCFAFFDGRLKLLGFLKPAGSPLPPFGDPDHDGSLEVQVKHYLTPVGHVDPLARWAFVRIGATMNQIAGLIVIDTTSSTSGRGLGVTQTWYDEDGDGIEELLAVLVTPRRPPDFRAWVQGTLAVFEWDRPGGILRARRLPDDGSVAYWSPPDGQPLSFAQAAPLDDVVQDLWPVPAPSTQPSASRPATPASRVPSARG